MVWGVHQSVSLGIDRPTLVQRMLLARQSRLLHSPPFVVPVCPLPFRRAALTAKPLALPSLERFLALFANQVVTVSGLVQPLPISCVLFDPFLVIAVPVRLPCFSVLVWHMYPLSRETVPHIGRLHNSVQG